MAKTLVASLRRAGDVQLDWIIVDELGRNLIDLLGGVPDDLDGAFTVHVIAPPVSVCRGGIDKLPAHNTARNAGLGEVSDAEYVVFLNDCNLVTIDWVSVARDCAKQGVGWKCKAHVIHDMPTPPDGVVRMRDHNDLLRQVPTMTVAGSCWGAPADAFEAVGGFDTAYDGQHKNGDVDIILRMSRTGQTFVATERAFIVTLRRTKVATEITTSKDAHAGARNQQLFNALQRDKDRIRPCGLSHADPISLLSPAPAPRAAPAGAVPIIRRGRARPVDPAPARHARRGRDAAPVKQPVSKEEFKAGKSAVVEVDLGLDQMNQALDASDGAPAVKTPVPYTRGSSRPVIVRPAKPAPAPVEPEQTNGAVGMTEAEEQQILDDLDNLT